MILFLSLTQPDQACAACLILACTRAPVDQQVGSFFFLLFIEEMKINLPLNICERLIKLIYNLKRFFEKDFFYEI